MPEIPPSSPFDQIRRQDERGEYWTGRDLMPLMAYTNWRQFREVVDRAVASAKATGHDTGRLFEVGLEKGAGRPREDVRLARFAAYLVAMNGDPRKPEVAAAQSYFVVKTREAEVAPAQFAIPQTYAQALQLAANQAQEIDEQRARLAIAEPKAEYVDGFVNPNEDAALIRVFAGQLGVGEKRLREWLVARRLIYRREVGRRWSRSQNKLVPEYQWLAHAGYQTWFVPRDQPEAPRLHNGQTATTLYITPVGKVGVRRLLMKHPIELTA